MIKEHCVMCGVEIVTGNECDCFALPAPEARATCPYFSHRAHHRGQAYIVCKSADGKSHLRRNFATMEARDAEYVRCCCAGGPCVTRGVEYKYGRELGKKKRKGVIRRELGAYKC